MGQKDNIGFHRSLINPSRPVKPSVRGTGTEGTRLVNTISAVTANKGEFTYLEIEVDGKPLAHHFVGRQGAHPPQISPLGWSSSSRV